MYCRFAGWHVACVVVFYNQLLKCCLLIWCCLRIQETEGLVLLTCVLFLDCYFVFAGCCWLVAAQHVLSLVYFLNCCDDSLSLVWYLVYTASFRHYGFWTGVSQVAELLQFDSEICCPAASFKKSLVAVEFNFCVPCWGQRQPFRTEAKIKSYTTQCFNIQLFG